ncbi:MAG: outer membrane beta-barrel protein [Terracidiphilus sp.]
MLTHPCRPLRRVLTQLVSLGLLFPLAAAAQPDEDEVQQLKTQVEELKALVGSLQSRVAVLEHRNGNLRASSTTGSQDAAALVRAAAELRSTPKQSPSLTALSFASEPSERPANSVVKAPSSQGPPQLAATPPPKEQHPETLPGGATLNLYFDGYFENNFNNPTGRVNDLRAYDVLSRVFSINQTDLIVALDPDVQAGRRYGMRVDLQFGQATETLQGNPAIEPRPEIYRNIFQAYGTYVIPVGSGLNFDFGKWASSLGIEGNYTKDQMNYSRSFYFYFLPFYHAGVRLHYNVNSKLGVNYWLVNGTNQSEPTNGYKDELFGVVLQPTKTLSWTVNYYLGQEHPDAAPANNCIIPVQPGLCFTPITPAPNGKLHIFDSYATWNATPKLTFAGEGDYVIQREWANAAPGESSAPSHTDGGAGYVQYQFSPRHLVAGRAEYLSDRGGMFSNATQALKEVTATYRHNFGDGFATFLEYRRDWSNIPYFVTSNPGILSTHQDTLGAGLVWWYGGKQGPW